MSGPRLGAGGYMSVAIEIKKIKIKTVSGESVKYDVGEVG